LHAVRRANLGPQDTVLLIGVGAIGSFICAGLAGHEGPIIALDIDESRLETARALGATETHLTSADATATELRDLVPDGADTVFETSGVVGAAARAFALAARGGKVVLVGLNKTPQPLNLADIVLREIDVRTTVAHVCSTDIPEALDLLTKTKLSQTLLDRIVPLTDVVSAGLQPLVSGHATGKILVDPRHG
jgi:(R,R)-butanediol dehydrogenase/meso-butanediol dehydrogenase/diacetyl reductase